MDAVRDRSGNIIYMINYSGARKVVHDKSGRVLGWVSEGKTYNSSGALVATGDAPGLLV